MTGNKCLSLGLVLCLVMPLRAVAAATVYFLHDESDPQHRQYVIDSEITLRKLMPELDTARVNLSEAKRLSAVSKSNALVISIGTRAAMLAVESDLPTLNTLVTRRHFESIKGMYRTPVTAIYLEQPLSRMMALIRATLPERDQLTILLGPSSKHMEHGLSEICVAQKMICTAMAVDDPSGIEQVLQFAGLHGKVVLVLPDQAIVNASTAHNLILGAYRRGVALVGYSSALVKAGALMSVHSTPGELGEDAASVAVELLKEQATSMPPARYPEKFSVAVNYQLARALHLDLVPESLLVEVIRQAESE